MKKIFYLFLVCLFLTTHCKLPCGSFCYKPGDCLDRDLYNEYYKCCYFYLNYNIKGETKELRQCEPLRKEEYDNQEDYIENYKKKYIEADGGTINEISLICDILREEDPCTREATKVEDCYYRTSGDQYYKCCYFDILFEKEGSTQERKECSPLTKSEYENFYDFIKNYKKKIEEDGIKIDKLSIDCDTEPNQCKNAKATSLSDCEGIDPGSKYYSCCFFDFEFEFEGKTTKTTHCTPLTLSEYSNLEATIKKGKENYESKGYKINKYILDCKGNSYGSSSNLNISILLLILILLFLKG